MLVFSREKFYNSVTQEGNDNVGNSAGKAAGDTCIFGEFAEAECEVIIKGVSGGYVDDKCKEDHGI